MSTASPDAEDEPVIRKRMPGRRVWPGGGRVEGESNDPLRLQKEAECDRGQGSISLPDW